MASKYGSMSIPITYVVYAIPQSILLEICQNVSRACLSEYQPNLLQNLIKYVPFLVVLVMVYLSPKQKDKSIAASLDHISINNSHIFYKNACALNCAFLFFLVSHDIPAHASFLSHGAYLFFP